jgi:hypothetical protein
MVIPLVAFSMRTIPQPARPLPVLTFSSIRFRSMSREHNNGFMQGPAPTQSPRNFVRARRTKGNWLIQIRPLPNSN